MVDILRSTSPYRVTAGLGAGTGAALVMMLAMLALRFLVGLPTIPELMLNALLMLMGGEAFSAALDTLYYAGRPLLFAAILEGILLLGVLLGLIYARVARPDVLTGRRHPLFGTPAAGALYGLLVGVLLDTVFLPLIGQEVFASKARGLPGSSPLPVWLGLIILALVYSLALQALLPRVQAPLAMAVAAHAGTAAARTLVPTSYDAPLDRRYFMRLAAGTLLAALGGAVVAIYGTYKNQGDSFAGPCGSEQRRRPRHRRQREQRSAGYAREHAHCSARRGPANRYAGARRYSNAAAYGYARTPGGPGRAHARAVHLHARAARDCHCHLDA